MKKYWILSAIIAVASCTGTQKDMRQDNTRMEQEDLRNGNELTIDSMERVRKDKLMEISCNLQFTNSCGTVSDSINASISQHILEQGRNSNVHEAMRDYVSKTYSQYKGEVEEMQARGDYFADMIFSFERNGRFMDDCADSVFTYEAISYTFLGGAHGYHSVTYLNFSRRTGHLITIGDVLDLSQKDAIIGLLVRDLEKQTGCNGMQELEDEGFISIRDMQVTDNFHMGKRGITFAYNPYDIACYALGKQFITLTYEQLRPYMK